MKILIALLVCISSSAYAQIVIGEDTLKGNIKRLTAYTYRGDYIVKSIYTWDAERLLVGKIYNESNLLRGKQAIKLDSNLRVIEQSLHCDSSLCNKTNTLYDAHGRKIEARTVDHINNCCDRFESWLTNSVSSPLTGCDSIVQQNQYEYDGKGLLARTLTKNVVYAHEYTDSSIKITEYAYDDLGNKLKTKTDKIKISMGVADTTVEITTYKYYEHDNSLAEIRTDNIDITLGVADTTAEVISYKYYNSSEQPAEVKKISFPLWPRHTDTVAEITYYKYDSAGNKVEESVFRSHNDYTTQNWSSDGKEITTKTVYSYDKRNNLVDEKLYFIKNDAFEKPAKERLKYSGKHIADGSTYTYDSLNNRLLRTIYKLYREDDGSETKHVDRTWEYLDSEERDRKEYDEHGNVIKIINGTTITSKREIEYFK